MTFLRLTLVALLSLYTVDDVTRGDVCRSMVSGVLAVFALSSILEDFCRMHPESTLPEVRLHRWLTRRVSRRIRR